MQSTEKSCSNFCKEKAELHDLLFFNSGSLGKCTNLSSLSPEECTSTHFIIYKHLENEQHDYSLLHENKEKMFPCRMQLLPKNSRGGYMAQGHDGKGNKMTTMQGKAAALKQWQMEWPKSLGFNKSLIRPIRAA